MPGFIADGQNIDAYVAASLPSESGESLHEELNFTYRPATRQECLVLDGEVRIAVKNADIDPKCLYKAEQIINKFLADKLKAWDLSHGHTVVEITPENLERVHWSLHGKIYQIVRGNRLSDKKPDGAEPKSHEDLLKN